MTWAQRSARTIQEIETQVNEFLKETKSEMTSNARMISGFNDSFIVGDVNDWDKEGYYVSVILSWMWGYAELAIVHRKSKDEYSVDSTPYLNFDNLKYDFSNTEVRDGIKDNIVKYYPAPFDERISELVADIKKGIKIIENLKNGKEALPVKFKPIWDYIDESVPRIDELLQFVDVDEFKQFLRDNISFCDGQDICFGSKHKLNTWNWQAVLINNRYLFTCVGSINIPDEKGDK